MSQEKLYEQIHEAFNYKDGNLYWKIKRQRIKAGNVAGYVAQNGYMVIMLNGKKHYAHRLIWLYHHGYMPTIIDHIDGNRSNNNIKNLRIATASQNQHNRVINKNNKTGIKGLSIVNIPVNGAIYTYYRADICNDHKSVRKYFSLDDKEEAKKFLDTARKEIHGEYARAE